MDLLAGVAKLFGVGDEDDGWSPQNAFSRAVKDRSWEAFEATLERFDSENRRRGPVNPGFHPALIAMAQALEVSLCNRCDDDPGAVLSLFPWISERARSCTSVEAYLLTLSPSCLLQHVSSSTSTTQSSLLGAVAILLAHYSSCAPRSTGPFEGSWLPLRLTPVPAPA